MEPRGACTRRLVRPGAQAAPGAPSHASCCCCIFPSTCRVRVLEYTYSWVGGLRWLPLPLHSPLNPPPPLRHPSAWAAGPLGAPCQRVDAARSRCIHPAKPARPASQPWHPSRALSLSCPVHGMACHCQPARPACAREQISPTRRRPSPALFLLRHLHALLSSRLGRPAFGAGAWNPAEPVASRRIRHTARTRRRRGRPLHARPCARPTQPRGARGLASPLAPSSKGSWRARARARRRRSASGCPSAAARRRPPPPARPRPAHLPAREPGLAQAQAWPSSS